MAKSQPNLSNIVWTKRITSNLFAKHLSTKVVYLSGWGRSLDGFLFWPKIFVWWMGKGFPQNGKIRSTLTHWEMNGSSSGAVKQSVIHCLVTIDWDRNGGQATFPSNQPTCYKKLNEMCHALWCKQCLRGKAGVAFSWTYSIVRCPQQLININKLLGGLFIHTIVCITTHQKLVVY